MMNTENYVSFLIEHNLTQEQFLLLILLKERRLDLIKLYKEKFQIENSLISKYFINDLIKKEFLVKINEQLFVGEKFLEIFINDYQAALEIYELYPSFITLNTGVQVPLKTMDINVFKEIYALKINNDLKEHFKVIEDLKYGIENNLITIGINKFITSEFWKSLRKLRIEKPNKKEELFETLKYDNKT